MNRPNLVCLDFDGTIMRYEDPPEHFHPDIIAALNHLRERGVEWIANSGRTRESQMEILCHCMEKRGLLHPPKAILSTESYIFNRVGTAYEPLESWNTQAGQWAREVNATLQHQHKEALQELIDRHVPAGVYFREDGTVFQMAGSEEIRQSFIADFERLLAEVPDAELINNGEWLAVVHRRLGKGNVLRAYVAHIGCAADQVLAVGDHGNDLSMLNGSVTPHVACPGNAFAPVREAVRRAGGYVATAHGPHGTLEAFHHYFAPAESWPELEQVLSTNTTS